MGVPKFFRYISERYPCLSELVRSHQVPEFDNLYLDMNGIVHNCTHPDDTKVNSTLTEEAMFLAIFQYIEYIFQVIKPRKVFFLAIDGVAPRAKMNQQRSRRFKTAKEMEMREAEAKRKGEVIQKEFQFDSNCITPGTEFMVRLQRALQYFIQRQITSNECWRVCKVILSGHDTPGEGEHKIMDYIRYIKAQPNYDPNTSHCLYGLDADLIMLGCCTHEAHISLLREEVKFGKDNTKSSCASSTRFFLLHLGILKEYLELEFSSIKDKLKFKFDIEKIVDDWIMMSFLVGNDFIPPLPNLHINNNALPLLYAAYMDIMPDMDGYINENGVLNLDRFEVFIRRLEKDDRELFREKSADFQYMNAKTSCFDDNVSDTDDAALAAADDLDMDNELSALVKASNEMYMDDMPSDEEGEEAVFDKEFLMHKRHYYITKMGYDEMTSEMLQEQAECYVLAIQWVLNYYYLGVTSWAWYYPHHYAPYISDIKNFRKMNIKFDLGKPFLPFEQLLAVLPPKSQELLPVAYRTLMTHPNSQIIDFYPEKFETDLNGKKQDWEALVLIPFINEDRLLTAMKSCENRLKDGERRRNNHGPMAQYEFTDESQGQLDGLEGLNMPGLAHVRCTKTEIGLKDIQIPINQMVFGPPKGALYDVYFPGFPTMKFLNYSGHLDRIRVHVFQMPSQNDTMVVKVHQKIEDQEKTIEEIYKDLLNKEIFVGWPHLTQAKVVAVSNSTTYLGIYPVTAEQEVSKFSNYVKNTKNHHKTRMGIELGEVKTLVHVYLVKSMSYVMGNNGKLKLSVSWDETKFVYPYQTVVRDISCYNKTFVMYKSVDEVYSKNSTVFLLSTKYYGSKGKILDTSMIEKTQRIQISIDVFPEPNFTPIFRLHQQTKKDNRNLYLNMYNGCSVVGISKQALNRITGQLFVIPGKVRQVNERVEEKVNIGLQLRQIKSNQEIPGYSKKVDYNWYLSNDALDLICIYLDKFPNLCQMLAKNDKMVFEEELMEEGGAEVLGEMTAFLKTLPHFKVRPREAGTAYVEKEVAAAIEEAVGRLKEEVSYKTVKLQTKLHLLYRPGSTLTPRCPDPDTEFSLFDRVVVATNNSTIPIGSKGTIVAIITEVNSNPIKIENKDVVNYLYEVLFDDVIPNGNSYMGDVAKDKVYVVPEQDLINITYGRSLRENRTEANGGNKQQTDTSTRVFEQQSKKTQAVESVPPQKTSPNESNEVKLKLNEIWNSLKQRPINPSQPTINATEPKTLTVLEPPIPPIQDFTESLKKFLKINSDPSQSIANKIPSSIQSPAQLLPPPPTQLPPPPPAQLPPPPPSWRIEAQISHLHKKQAEIQNHIVPPRPEMIAPPHFPTNPNRPQMAHPPHFFPHPFPFAANMMHPPVMYPPVHPPMNQHHQQSIYVQPRFPPAWQQQPNQPPWIGAAPPPPMRFQARPPNQNFCSPKGPQTLRNTSGIGATNQGAFIPLQAARKNTKYRNNSQPTTEGIVGNNLKKQSGEVLSNTSSNRQEENKVNRPQEKPIVPLPKPRKIAAHFSSK